RASLPPVAPKRGCSEHAAKPRSVARTSKVSRVPGGHQWALKPDSERLEVRSPQRPRVCHPNRGAKAPLLQLKVELDALRQRQGAAPVDGVGLATHVLLPRGGAGLPTTAR